MKELSVLFQDEHICVCRKPAGIPCESAVASRPDMVKLLKRRFFLEDQKGGEPDVFLVHRLDQPVGGIMVFARNQAVAAQLSRQIRDRQFIKRYFAIAALAGGEIKPAGHWEDYLIREKRTNMSRSVSKKESGAKLAVLDYEILGQRDKKVLVNVMPVTGRHHQIRVQMAAHGLPLLYDRKYSSCSQNDKDMLALYAYHLAFCHPASKEFLTFKEYPDAGPFAEWKDTMANFCGMKK